jgi:hypothetical protein
MKSEGSFENWPRTEFDELCERMSKEGWQYDGLESLYKDKFKDGRFEPLKVATPEELTQRYGRGETHEVKLIETVTSDIKELLKNDPALAAPDHKKMFFVFSRKKTHSNT